MIYRALSNSRLISKDFSAKSISIEMHEIREMARENLILICISLILTQLVIVSSNEEDINWTTIQDEFRKLAGNVRKKCMGETGVTIDLLNGAEEGEFPSDDKTLGCYFKCVMEKGGLMKKDGKMNFKIISKMMPQALKKVGLDMTQTYKEIALDILNQCRDIEDNDKCVKALNFNQCIYRANPIVYMVI